jgi:hypothetical protein
MAQWLNEALLTLRKEPDNTHQLMDSHDSNGGLLCSLIFVVPLIWVLATHLWMRSAYTSHVFHLQGFLEQYSSGVYRYRIVGRELLLSTYRLLSDHRKDQPFSMPTDTEATLLFYAAYVLLNAVFFFFSNLMLLLLLRDRKKGVSDLHLALYLFVVLLLVLSAYTVTPYDQLAYFFMLICFLSVRIRRPLAMYLVLGIAAVVGSLNRESQYLVTPALLTVALFTTPEESRRYFYAGLYHLFLFAGCYLGLRIFLPGVPMVAAGITLGGKWALPSLIVLITVFYCGVSMAMREYANRRPALVLLLLSAPYIVTVLLSGELRELRLLIPLLLCLIFVYVQLTALRNRALAFGADLV